MRHQNKDTGNIGNCLIDYDPSHSHILSCISPMANRVTHRQFWSAYHQIADLLTPNIPGISGEDNAALIDKRIKLQRILLEAMEMVADKNLRMSSLPVIYPYPTPRRSNVLIFKKTTLKKTTFKKRENRS